MAIGDLKDVLHKIKVKLYPNYLPDAKGGYIARTDSEATLSVEDVCAALINRGGYEGKYAELVDTVKQYNDEVAYQLCDGYAVSNGYFAVHPNIGGTFNDKNEVHDHVKHPINFRFRALKQLRELASTITVEILGVADTNGYIMEFTDVATGAVNETLTFMNQFVITGYKLKVAGDDPEAGVYFVMPGTTVSLKAGLAENTPSRLIGMIPSGPNGIYKVVVKTQFTGSGGIFLKAPRTIESSFTLSRGV
jgi:hypothetical protein